MTINELFDEYINSKAKINLKTSSISTYIKVYDAQIKKYFENQTVDKLLPKHLNL